MTPEEKKCYLIYCDDYDVETTIYVIRQQGKCNFWDIWCPLMHGPCPSSSEEDESGCMYNPQHDVIKKELSEEDTIIFKLEHGL